MKSLGFACLALISCFALVQSQTLLVRWNDAVIIDANMEQRLLLYHEDIDMRRSTSGGTPDGPGILICRHSGNPGDVEWLPPTSDTPVQSNNNDDFRIIRQTGSPTRSQLARTVETPATAMNEGLWSCNGGGLPARHVAIYGTGRGSIERNVLSLGPSPNFGSSPQFTLAGDTSGGPPTTILWRRNGRSVDSSGSFVISTVANPDDDQDGRENCRYRSTLTVTDMLPGVYEYRASNRATSGDIMGSFTIEGGDPTNLQLEQTGLNVVEVTWDPPTGPPAEYRVVDTGNSIDMPTQTPSLTIDMLPLGVYNIRVMYTSQHFPGGMVEPETITVRGALAPVVSLTQITATSVRVSWTRPDNSFTVMNYEVGLTRLTSCDSITGIRGPRDQNADDMTEPFVNLGEYITYRAGVTANFQSPSSFSVSPAVVEMEFTTLAIAPSEVPSNVVPTMTSRSINVSWDAIDCSNQNGPNFRYEVDFRRVGGADTVAGMVNGVMFTANGLQPFTDYTFRVQAVNDEDSGDYTNLIMVQTDQDTPGEVGTLMRRLISFTSIEFTWSPPQEPNGIITMYELTYRTNDSSPVSMNFTDRLNFTMNFEVNTRLTEIRVRAYTVIGPGPFVMTADITLVPPIVTNVAVERDSDTSVRVTWDRITSISGITGYIVYYAPVSSRKRQNDEQSVTVPGTEDSVVIMGLESTVVYQYQVVAVAMLGGKQLEGERSPVTDNTRFRIVEPGGGGDGVIIGVVIAVLAAVVVVGVIIVVLFLLWLRRRSAANRKLRSSVRSNVSTVHYARTPGQMVNLQDVIEPRIDDFPEDTNALEGESVVFKVVVSGKPVPTLTWYFDDNEITSDYSQEILDDGSLSIPSAEVKQSGVYKLLARNSAGSVQQQVKLTVQIEKDRTPDFGGTSVTFEPVPVSQFGEYVVQNHSSNNQGFRDQFMALESGDHYAKTIGLSSDFKKLNRFANITNYDHNRIVLKPLQGHPDCNNEFVNGCYIDGYSLPKKFIATQGPTPKTMIDFWRLIWQEKPPTIVMVTNLKENNKKKCEQYWPESGSSNFGPFKVTVTEHQVFADYCIRTMQVTVEGGPRPHKLKQFHFTAWPDHGVPDYATPMLAFHRRIAAAHNPRRGPMLVHCSAGVGRTGTFICIDNVQEQIKKEQVVDIAGIINKMRHQRMKMVQTPEQYCFLHDAMLESVTCGDTQITAADLRMKIAKYQKVDSSTGQTTFQSQFNVLDQVSPKLSEVICKTALQHPTRNRNGNYLPPDRYRVILKGEQPDYIHASFAHGYKHQKAYMVAEGPMSTTARNMLKLLYDRKCGVVVMLSGLQENGTESCFQYWPAVGSMDTQGEYTVDLISEEALEGFTIRKISILEQKSQKAHQVTQFHITCWAPDGQCSNLRCVVDVIDEMEKVQRRTGNKPIFVHCSDTVTRSGMFCAMATVIDRCKTEGVVDVFQVVKALRIQRPGAVPTVDNYKTLFDATLTFLDSFDTYANFQNV